MEGVIQPATPLDLAAIGWLAGWQDPDLRTVTEFAAECVCLPGSALGTIGNLYDPAETPWNTEPLNNCHIDSPVRRNIYVKPVQSGGSSAGEAALVYWLRNSKAREHIGFYWESDKKAQNRWLTRVEPILRASPALADVLPFQDKTKFRKCKVVLQTFFLNVLGVISRGNTASDSYKRLICEEVHAWPDGKLKTAEGRTTAYQKEGEGFFVFVISNASLAGDQLHRAQTTCTNQIWMVRCPGCRQFHTLRREWREDEPQHGGLRYDSNAPGVKLENGDYNYERLKSTLRIQAPCGYPIRPIYQDRKALSQTGKYSEPRNPGADLVDRSYTLDAVNVHNIDLVELVKEQHQAQKAARYGDLEPMRKLWQERDCRFWDPQKFLGSDRVATLSSAKAEEGLKDRVLRTMYVDRQLGVSAKDETPHWWIVIRDWAPNGDSRLVYEGKVLTKEDVEETRIKFEVEARFVGVDSGADTVQVYRMAAKYGYTVFKGVGGGPNGGRRTFVHEAEDSEGVPYKFRRHFSPGEWRDPYAGDREGRAGQSAVYLILYCKASIRDHLHFLRTAGEVKWEVPAGVSDDYHAHLQSEILDDDGNWKQVATRNDELVCELGNSLIAHIAGVIAAPNEAVKVTEDVTPENET